jgi:hypothetical protein
VTVYWGTTNGGETPGSWQHSASPTSPSQPQGAASFTCNITGLSKGATYYFSAKAVNSAGTSWPGGSASFQVPLAPSYPDLAGTGFLIPTFNCLT